MNKILIIGNGGAGKSTLADWLGKRLSLPVTHLDTIYWKTPTEPLSNAEFDRLLTKLLKRKRWILDGNYRRTLERRVEAADTVIFVDTPKLVTVWRVFQRALTQRLTPEQILSAGNPPGIRLDFLRWILTYPRDEMIQRVRAAVSQNTRFLIIKNNADLAPYLESTYDNEPET